MDNLKSKAEKPKTRLEALADGTFAIVFTILVLDLTIRDKYFETEMDFKNFIVSLAPKFLSYLLSFCILATYWLGHTEQLFFASRINRPFALTNLLFLFFISLIPFSTSLISEYREFSLSVRLYGLNLLGCQLSFLLNWMMTSSRRISENNLEVKIIKGHNRYIVFGLIFQLLGIGVSYINATIGLILLCIIPIVYLIVFATDKRNFEELYVK